MRSGLMKLFVMIAINGTAAILWLFAPGWTPAGPGAVAAATAPSGETRAAEAKVEIDNFTFTPRSLTVARGTKVTWVNADDVPHTATSTETPPLFNSGLLDTDGSFSFTFEKAGTYRYFCGIHPHMTGEIVVK